MCIAEYTSSFAQVLRDKKVLVGIREKDHFKLRIEGISKLSRQPETTIKTDGLGEFLVAFDEQQRLLVVCACVHVSPALRSGVDNPLIILETLS